ncbi:MAG TPA: hypothetical protein VFR09_03100 [Alphaproteobacteria bacterium]|nr:hypothetical protein [Alphaproteobacteria bacterium]
MHIQRRLETPASAPTYGIHILKAWMIFFQILAHAHLWAVGTNSFLTNPFADPIWIYIAMGFGCFGMVVPMTAGAVLRMICTADKNNRVVNIDWRSMITTMLLLALFESTKDAFFYDLSAFFMWNVLHLIAVTVLLMLFIAQFGMRWLWSAALTILFITPFVIRSLDPYETLLTKSLITPDWPLQGIVFAGILTLIAGVLRTKLTHSNAFMPKHKKRMMIVLALSWLLATIGCLQMRNGIMTISAFKTLWIGALAGTHSGLHIWGFFPWAGTIMLGFLIYDLIIRAHSKPIFIACLFVCGTILLAYFYYEFGPDTAMILGVTKRSVLSGIYLNRQPALAILIIGLFCTMAPVSYLLMRLGCERGYVIALSRSILWIYIYQTSLLAIAPPYFKKWLPGDEGLIAYAIFALASSLALPLILQRIPFRIHLQIKKRAAEV